MKKYFFILFLSALFLGVNAQSSGTTGFWDLQGNDQTFGRCFIGTTDNQPLIFKTFNTERMRLLSNKSFLGIGIPTPLAALHLHYQSDMNNDPPFPQLLQLTTPTCTTGFSIISNRDTKDIYFRQQESAKFFLEGPNGGLVVAQDGKVGLGTDAPKQKLHIDEGNLLITSVNSGTINAPQGALLFGNVIDNNYPYGKWGIEYIFPNSTNHAGNGLNFRNFHNQLSTNPNDPVPSVLFLADDGRVGIGGINNPQAALDVLGSFNAFSATITEKLGIGVSNPLTNMQIGNLWTFQGGTSHNNMGRNTYNNGTKDVRIATGAASRISFNSSGEILLQTIESDAAGSAINRWNTVTFANNGYVGIGTTAAPRAMLDVNGDAQISGMLCTQEIKVKLAPCWPDYVFSKDYHLLPLNEVEQFITENQHLPNVPSAAEVEANGVNVGEMNAILLQKMEEMTLYIIDLQKQIDELKK